MTTHSIGATNTPITMDYTSLATWGAACPANLVTAGSSWIGQVYNQGEINIGSSSVSVTTTSSWTDRLVLEAAPGASFQDDPNAATNPLRYNNSVGAAITGNVSYDAMFRTSCDTEVSGLQFRGDGGSGTTQSFGVLRTSTDGSSQSYIHECIIQNAGVRVGGVTQIFAIGNSSSSVVNCLVFRETATSNGSDTSIAFNGGGTAQNNTCYCNGGTGITAQYAALVLDDNVIIAAVSGQNWAVGRSNNVSGFNNATDDTSFGGNTGGTNTLSGSVSNVAFTTSNYVGVSGVTHNTGSGYDFRTLLGSALVDTGSTAHGSSIDILGTSRPQGTAADIGAYELPSGGGGSFSLSISESGTAADSPTETMAATPSLAESGTAADAPTIKASCTLTESGTAADTPSATLTASASVTETATGADTVSVTVSVSVAEAGSAADNPTETTAATASVSEAGTAADAPGITASVSLAEAGTAATTQTQSTAASASVSESASGADSPSATMAATASVAEAGTAVDTVGTGQFVNEVASAADAPSATLAASASLAEAAAAADTPTYTVTLTASLAESGTAADTPSAAARLLLTETASAADSITISYLGIIVEAVTAVDICSATTTSPIFPPFTPASRRTRQAAADSRTAIAPAAGRTATAPANNRTTRS